MALELSAGGFCTIDFREPLDFRDPLFRNCIAELRSARAGQGTRPYVGCGGAKTVVPGGGFLHL